MARLGPEAYVEVGTERVYPSAEKLRAGLAIATIGCASLFSWNAVITASGYYGQRFCGTIFRHSFESVFSITYQVTSLFGNVYATRQTEEMAAERRLVPPLKALCLLFVGFTVLACATHAPRDWVFVPLTLLGVAGCGVLSQALCAALYGVAAALPSEFMPWNMAGQAAGGLIPAMIVVLSDLAESVSSSNDNDEDGCHDGDVLDPAPVGYFAAAAALFALAVLAFRLLGREAIYKDYVSGPAAKRRSTRRTRDEAELALVRDQDEVFDVGYALRLARIVAIPASTVFLIFAVTLSTFPTLTALARPKGHADDDDGAGDQFRRLFVPLLFLEFNLGDFVGRTLAPLCQNLVFRPKLLLAAASTRVLFLPMIALGELVGSSRNNLHATRCFRQSYAPFAIMLPFSLSNGLLATLAMGAGAPLVHQDQRELVGNILSLFLSLGLAAGSGLSFVLLRFI